MNIDNAMSIAGRALLGGVIAGVAVVLAAGVMSWKVALQ